MERSEPSVSLLRSIEAGQRYPSAVPISEWTVNLRDMPANDNLGFVGLAHGTSRLDPLLPVWKRAADTKISCSKIALSILGTSRTCDQHVREVDCILACPRSVFIHQRLDFRSDLSRSALSDKGRISADHGPPAFKDLSRRSLQCSKVLER